MIATHTGNPIKFRGKHWCVMSRDGKWVLSKHQTLVSAREWKSARGLEAPSGGYRHLHLMAATGALRIAQLEERDHLVIPVVALVEGVITASNSEGPELVLAEEFAKSASIWNQKPICYDHPYLADGTRVSAGSPEINDQFVIGRIFNSRVENKKLLMDAYIDLERAEKLGAEKLITAMREGEMGEVSVGVIVKTVAAGKGASWFGDEYVSVWREIGPDHLAFLPLSKEGACSNEMGCGAPRAAVALETNLKLGFNVIPETTNKIVVTSQRAAARKEGESTMKLRDLLHRLLQSGQAELKDGEGLSDSALRNMLNSALRDVEPGYSYIYDVYPDDGLVVYCVYREEREFYLRRGFSATDDEVTLSPDTEEVTLETTFVPASAGDENRTACGCRKNAAKEEGDTMTPEEKAQVEDLRNKLAALEAQAKTQREEAEQKQREAEAKEKKDLEEKVRTLQAEVDSTKKIVEEVKQREASRKTELIKTCSAAQKEFSETELASFSVEQLEKLVKTLGAKMPTHTFAPAAPAVGTNDKKVPEAVSFSDFNTRVAERGKKSA